MAALLGERRADGSLCTSLVDQGGRGGKEDIDLHGRIWVTESFTGNLVEFLDCPHRFDR
jgi:hypothetical protein